MKVVNLCSIDWANYSYDNAMALRSIGIDANGYVINKHQFDYPQTSVKATPQEMETHLKDADFVQIMHSCKRTLDIFLRSNSKAKLIVHHAGSVYRRNPQEMNLIFNPHIHKSVLALPEFWELGAKNPVYSVGAVAVDKFCQIKKEVKKPYIVCHFPSSEMKKGTAEIVKMMKKISCIFKYDSLQLSAQQHIARLADCDIYIELFKPFLEDKPYGSFGIQALESAAMGQVVVTQNLHPKVYENHYGDCGLVLVKNKDDFIYKMDFLTNMSEKEFIFLKEKTRQWVFEKHSYTATGKRYAEVILR